MSMFVHIMSVYVQKQGPPLEWQLCQQHAISPDVLPWHVRGKLITSDIAACLLLAQINGHAIHI